MLRFRALRLADRDSLLLSQDVVAFRLRRGEEEQELERVGERELAELAGGGFGGEQPPPRRALAAARGRSLLALVAERYKVSSVARVARRRVNSR